MKISRTHCRIAVSILMASATLGILAGCAETHQTRKVTPSGFLGDYSRLSKGKGEEAQLIYVSPEADFSRYTKIMMDPVVAYATNSGQLSELKPEHLQALLDYMDAKFREELGKDFTFVTTPGPTVMHLRLALTEANASRVVSDTVSTVLPIGIAVSAVKRVTFGRGIGVGSARAELEMLDSQTGNQLVAAVDERAGTKYTGRIDKFSRWEDARDAIDFWATRARDRLAELREEDIEQKKQ